MAENNNLVPSLEESVTSIYEYLYLPSLDKVMLNSLTLYMEAYNQTLEEYNQANTPSEELTNRLRILSGPVEFVLTHFNENNDEPLPAVDFIKAKLSNDKINITHNNSIIRARKNPSIPSTLPPEEVYIQTNGFTTAIIIVIITIILGIVLGSLLFFKIK